MAIADRETGQTDPGPMKQRLLDALRRILPRPVKRVGRQALGVAQPLKWAGRQAWNLTWPVQYAGRRGWSLMNKARARTALTVGVQPLSFLWGADRGWPIFSYYLHQFVREFQADIRGHCLEFQDNNYTRAYGRDAVTKSDILHL